MTANMAQSKFSREGRRGNHPFPHIIIFGKRKFLSSGSTSPFGTTNENGTNGPPQTLRVPSHNSTSPVALHHAPADFRKSHN